MSDELVLLTLTRFYLGAFRFVRETPSCLSGSLDVVWNLVNMGLLFVGFFIAARLVRTDTAFLMFVGAFHVLDLMWFSLILPRLAKSDKELSSVLGYYVAFDVATCLAAGTVGFAFWLHPFGGVTVQLLTSTLLVVMFCVDVLWLCRDFYFNPRAWRTTMNRSSLQNVQNNLHSRSSVHPG